MLRLNRTTEYSLIALRHIRSKKTGELTSAREIADRFDLPFEILAKTLQKLKDQGIIAATFGTRGGYVLSTDLKSLNLSDFLAVLEGPTPLVACTSNSTDDNHTATGPSTDGCAYSGACNIKKVMGLLNDKVQAFLKTISIDELTRDDEPVPLVKLNLTPQPEIPAYASQLEE